MIEETSVTTVKKEGLFKKIIAIVLCVAIGLIAVASILNAIFFQPVEIVGASMENTLKDGEVVLVNKRQKPTYGDIIIIENEKQTDLIVKRFIAGAGDTVKILDGQLLIKFANSEDFTPVSEEYAIVPENYIYESEWLERECPDGYTLKENEVFYLGDNRENSLDSRSDYRRCDTSQIIGVARGFSLKTKKVVTAWHDFKDKVRIFLGLEPELYKNING